MFYISNSLSFKIHSKILNKCNAKILLKSKTFSKFIGHIKRYFDKNKVCNNKFWNEGIEGKIDLKMGKTLIVEAIWKSFYVWNNLSFKTYAKTLNKYNANILLESETYPK